MREGECESLLVYDVLCYACVCFVLYAISALSLSIGRAVRDRNAHRTWAFGLKTKSAPENRSLPTPN